MVRFGAYYRGEHGDTVTWFQTSQTFAAGPYVLGTTESLDFNVYIEESVAALLMHVSDWVRRSELEGQEELRSPHMTDQDVQRLAESLTKQLIQRLSDHNDQLWEHEPHWLARVRSLEEDAS